MRTALMTLTLLAPLAAEAFCGTYVGPAGAEIYNNVSQVVLVREGDRTTLTFANDFEGTLDRFALVVPVPPDLRPKDVRVVSAEVVERMDAYTTPRLVEYTCDDLMIALADAGSASMSCGGGPATPESADGVRVEARFQEGEYDLVLLSAEESTGLLDWLDANGYAVDGVKQALFEEIIRAGGRFLAAKVALDRVPEGQAFLSPLQLSYESTGVMLPIRLGTTASSGAQDLIVYAITDQADGTLKIDNYPRVDLDDECMWRGDGETFGSFYADRFDAAVAEAGGAAWVREYLWFGGKCDPCTADPLEKRDLRAVGYEGSLDDVAVTRLHMRYDADVIDQDVLFVRDGELWPQQVRFIRYDHALEDTFPICDVGWLPEPGSCWDEDEGVEGTHHTRPTRWSSTGGGGLLASLLLLAAGIGRRRALR